MIYHGDACQYVLETPDILRNIMEQQNAIFCQCCKLLKQRELSEIYLVGSGSSYHSAIVAADFMKKLLGIPVLTVYPIDFMDEIELASNHALLIGISQQGTSVAVIKAMDKMNEKGGLTISCTGEYDTEITRHAQANIYVECGIEDAGSTTKGYTATAFTLLLLGLHIAKERNLLSEEIWNRYQKQLKDITENISKVIAASIPWCEKQGEDLSKCSDLIILASGQCKKLIPEVVLKFSESCRFPVRGYAAEEFMHGMYNAVNETTQFLYLFAGEGEEDNRLWKLYEYYQSQHNRQYCINVTVEQGLAECFTKRTPFSVLELIIPLQILFIHTSRKRGINLNIPKDPDFHKYMQSKIEE
ncbi:MAG: SIS domain-containing protein [Lachnospiraceae bacterium]|nr:SIS domain-containing protein [Lachnospiraceae bacterium]